MDTKRLYTMMLLCFAVIFGWKMCVEYLYSTHPQWQRPEQATTMPTTEPTATPAPAPSSTNPFAGIVSPPAGPAPATALAIAPTTVPATASAATPGSGPASAPSMTPAPLHVIASTQPSTQPTILTMGDSTAYRMIVKVSTTGAGIESITLPEQKSPDANGEYVFQTPTDPADPNTRSLATRAISVNGAMLNLADQQWTIDSQSPKSVALSIDCGLVRVRKIYELLDKSSPGLGYELLIRHEVENKTQQPLKVAVAFAGPTMPPRESERGPDLQILGGYDAGYEKVVVDHKMVEELSSKKPEWDMTTGPDKAKLLWAGTSSVYFDAIVRPEPLDKGVSPKYIARLTATALNPDSEAQDRHVGITFATSDFTVPAGGSIAIPATSYFGPRWRNVLNEPHYATFPLSYDSTLVLTSGFCGFCTFQFLITGLVKLLAFFHFLTRDWGIAIILLVVLVRAILHPITKRSQVSMMRMGKMGPEMERLKKKYADDKDELNKQTMALYKDQGVGAYLGCLPMFLQTPIWIALWSALQSTFELRQAPFLYGFTWIHDLAKPDRLFHWQAMYIPLPVIGAVHFSSINILPFLMAVMMYFQQKLTPQPPSATKEQESQKKMMLWMSVLMFPIFLYNGPAGLNLYILTSSTIGIFESKRIRAHIQEKEEQERAGRIIIDAPKSMKKRRDDDFPGASGKKNTPAKAGIAGWIASLQTKAEELRQQAQKDKKKKK